MANIKFNTVCPEDFIRVNNDVNGNPRYVTRYSNLSDDYAEAVVIAKSIGGRKFHTSLYGGGIVISSYSLKDDCESLNDEIIKHHFADVYVSYLLDSFSADGLGYEFDLGFNKVEAIQAVAAAEIYKGKSCEDYMRGLPSAFAIEFANFQIINWGKRKKLLRSNASEQSCSAFVDVYWSNLGKALEKILAA